MVTKTEKIQLWLAFMLTFGEWGIAVYAVIAHGELTMIYLAVTYLMRETHGGRHYHVIVMEAIHKLHPRFFE